MVDWSVMKFQVRLNTCSNNELFEVACLWVLLTKFHASSTDN